MDASDKLTLAITELCEIEAAREDKAIADQNPNRKCVFYVQGETQETS